MKKLLGLTILTLFFTCCEVGVRDARSSTYIDDPSSMGIYATEYSHEGFLTK
jgi:hypothetical protein